MRRGIGAVALLVVLLGGVGIAVGAYNAGERHGVVQGIEQVQVAQENGQDVQVVHVLDEGHHGFFPGFFLFPLFFVGLFFVRWRPWSRPPLPDTLHRTGSRSPSPRSSSWD